MIEILLCRHDTGIVVPHFDIRTFLKNHCISDTFCRFFKHGFSFYEKQLSIEPYYIKIGNYFFVLAPFLAIQKEFGSFSNYMWAWVEGEPIQNKRLKQSDVPAVTPLAEAMAKDLKKRGFKFLGPTICYAFMQAVGMVNDHTSDCFRNEEIKIL